MDASTLRHAADTVTDTVVEKFGDLGEAAQRIAAKTPEAAQRLAAITPWVEAPARKSHALRRWAMAIAAMAILTVFARWWATRRTESAGIEPRGNMTPPTEAERRLTAAAG